jgi:hypothetical protein
MSNINSANLVRPFRETYELHNVLLGDTPAPWHSAIGMFLPVILWAVFAGIYVLVVRRQTARLLETSGATLLAMAVLPLCCALFYQCYEELDPYFTLLAKLDPHMPRLLLHAIINRWFNFAGFMLPLLPLAILALLVNNQRSLFALAALANLLCFTTGSWGIGMPYQALTPETFILHVYPHGVFFIAVAVLALFNGYEPKLNLPHISVLCQVAPWLFLLIVAAYHGITAGDKTTQRGQELASGKFDQIIATVKKEKATVIYASGIYGGNGFLPQLTAVNYPYILPNYISVNTPYGDLYCYTGPRERIDRLMVGVQSCFEGHTESQWRALAEGTHATALLVPQTWKLKLTPAFTSGGLSYYHLH